CNAIGAFDHRKAGAVAMVETRFVERADAREVGFQRVGEGLNAGRRTIAELRAHRGASAGIDAERRCALRSMRQQIFGDRCEQGLRARRWEGVGGPCRRGEREAGGARAEGGEGLTAADGGGKTVVHVSAPLATLFLLKPVW